MGCISRISNSTVIKCKEASMEESKPACSEDRYLSISHHSESQCRGNLSAAREEVEIGESYSDHVMSSLPGTESSEGHPPLLIGPSLNNLSPRVVCVFVYINCTPNVAYKHLI